MKETINNLKRVYKFSKGSGKYLVFYLIGSVLLCLIGVVAPIVSSMQLINITNSIWQRAFIASILLFTIEMFNNIIRFLSRKFSQIFFRETVYSIQSNMAREILKIEVPCIDKHTTGVFIQRLSNDASSLSNVFTRGCDFLSTIITDIGVFIAVLIISPVFFIYYIAMFLVMLYFEKLRIKKITIKDRKYRDQREKTSGLATELVRGVRDIKMLNSEESFMNEVEDNLYKLNQKGYEMSDVSRKYSLIVGSIRDINNLLLAILIIYFVSKGHLLLSLGVVIFSYRHYIYSLVASLGFFLDYIRDFNLSCERVFAIFDSDEFKKEEFGTNKIEKINGNFEFKNVSFSYNKDNKVLDNLSFKVNTHETVAFVGKSGAGKTTIFSLLCKLYTVDKGNIYIDGIDINSLDKNSIRGNITIISQSPYIFNMSIKDNLRLVKDDLTEEEMINVCKIACLDDYINTLPDKYDTVVGESGITLSGGQKQRLAIARALLQKTKIILFDEATSALDNETQSKIQQAINNMKNDYTILIIAHRLSTIINSDKIMLLDEGKIIATGTHDELMARSKVYKDLYEAEIEK